MTTKAGHVRQVIKSFAGRPFRATELPKYPGLHATLQKFINSREISVEFEEPSPDAQNKPRKVYKEICIKEERINAAVSKKKEKPTDVWKSVWPELYAPPTLCGSTRVFVAPLD